MRRSERGSPCWSGRRAEGGGCEQRGENRWRVPGDLVVGKGEGCKCVEACTGEVLVRTAGMASGHWGSVAETCREFELPLVACWREEEKGSKE